MGYIESPTGTAASVWTETGQANRLQLQFHGTVRVALELDSNTTLTDVVVESPLTAEGIIGLDLTLMLSWSNSRDVVVFHLYNNCVHQQLTCRLSTKVKVKSIE